MLLFSAAPGPEPGLETLTARIAQGDRTAWASCTTAPKALCTPWP